MDEFIKENDTEFIVRHMEKERKTKMYNAQLFELHTVKQTANLNVKITDGSFFLH